MRNLPGADVFMRSHVMYMGGVHRANAAAWLNYESYKAFEDLFIIKHAKKMADDTLWQQEFFNSKKMIGIDAYQPPYYHLRFMEIQNLEYLKIGCGIELCLKAKLVNLGVIVHEIERDNLPYKALKEKQKNNEPVYAEEMRQISDYKYNGSVNILPGITNKSLPFSTITNQSHYYKLYQMDPTELLSIQHYRDLRNEIHLPMDQIQPKSNILMDYNSQIQFIRNFVRKHIVEVNRKLCKEHSLIDILSITEFEPNQSLSAIL